MVVTVRSLATQYCTAPAIVVCVKGGLTMMNNFLSGFLEECVLEMSRGKVRDCRRGILRSWAALAGGSKLSGAGT